MAAEQSPQEQLVLLFRKLAPGIDRGIIASRDFNGSVFDEFSYIDCVYPDIIPVLWDLVPSPIRIDFVAKIHDISRPDYRWTPSCFEARETNTDELDRRTVRVRAWASEFLQFLDNDDAQLRDTIRTIEQGLADAECGRTRPFREVLDEIRNGRTDDAADDTNR